MLAILFQLLNKTICGHWLPYWTMQIYKISSIAESSIGNISLGSAKNITATEKMKLGIRTWDSALKLFQDREKIHLCWEHPPKPKDAQDNKAGRKNMYLTEGADDFWSLISHRFLCHKVKCSIYCLTGFLSST